jgi:hypothetical protein
MISIFPAGSSHSELPRFDAPNPFPEVDPAQPVYLYLPLNKR